jgi:hypothetical protein
MVFIHTSYFYPHIIIHNTMTIRIIHCITHHHLQRPYISEHKSTSGTPGNAYTYTYTYNTYTYTFTQGKKAICRAHQVRPSSIGDRKIPLPLPPSPLPLTPHNQLFPFPFPSHPSWPKRPDQPPSRYFRLLRITTNPKLWFSGPDYTGYGIVVSCVCLSASINSGGPLAFTLGLGCHGDYLLSSSHHKVHLDLKGYLLV